MTDNLVNQEQAIRNERFSTFPQLSLEVGGISGSRYKNLLTNYSGLAGDLLDKLEHLDEQEHIATVEFRLRDVGIRGMAGWNKVVRAVKKEGLDFCPQLTAPEMAHLNTDIIIIKEREYAYILSKPIIDRDGDPYLFVLSRGGGGLWLSGGGTDSEWGPGTLVVGRLR